MNPSGSNKKNKSTNESKSTKLHDVKSKQKTKAIAESKPDADTNKRLRSESLSRIKTNKVAESPRKSQSIDRNHSNKTEATNVSKNASGKSNSVYSVKSKHKKNISDDKVLSKAEVLSKSSIQSKKSNSSKSSKRISDSKRTNLQIAKSFVQSSESEHKNSKKKSNDENIINNDGDKTKNTQDILRPRTSTKNKEFVDSKSVHLEAEKKEYGLRKGNTSRSKSSLNKESDDDRASYEDDFEDYDSDFENSVSESSSEENSEVKSGSSTDDAEITEHNIEQNINGLHLSPKNFQLSKSNTAENQVRKNSHKGFLNMSDRSSFLTNMETEPSIKPVTISRSFINFESAVLDDKENNKKNDPIENYSNLENIESLILAESKALTLSLEKKFNKISDIKQAFVQTEKLDEQDVQTDEIDVINKWTQIPTNSTLGCGGDKVSTYEDSILAWKSLFNVHSTKLSNFLRRTSNVILTLLEEEDTPTERSFSDKKRSNFFGSKGYYEMIPVDFLTDVPIVNIYCCPGSSPYLLTTHSNIIEVKSSNTETVAKGIICVWNMSENKKPEFILTSNSSPTCATFGSGTSDIIVAGMVDGAVMLWDLTELKTSSLTTDCDTLLNFRSPTYNTALVDENSGHRSCIVRLHTVHSETTQKNIASLSKVGNTKSFHVMTLEDLGVLNIWIVVEVLQPDISGLESDLGLAPGGKYRLVKSASLLLFEHSFLQMHQKISIRTFDFVFVPGDTSRMLVTTDAGIVLHVSRHSGNIEPRFYTSKHDFCPEVRCIDCSPYIEDLFLVGCSDGSVKLYNLNLARPLLELPHAAKGDSINLLQWSVSHPSQFYLLSDTSHIHLWNLMTDVSNPTQSYCFEESKITWFALKTAKSALSSKENRLFNLIIAKEIGELEVHICEQKVSKEEFVKQMNYLKNL